MNQEPERSTKLKQLQIGLLGNLKKATGATPR